jgi:hypothetical protein
MACTPLSKDEMDMLWDTFSRKWDFAPNYYNGIGIQEHGEFLTISAQDLTDAQETTLLEIQKMLGRPATR